MTTDDAGQEEAQPASSVHVQRNFLSRVPVSLWVILAYTFLTVIMTWPIAANLTTQVPGGGDAWQHIWNLWWAKKSLLELHTNPYHTDLLYWPDGVNLYFHTLVLSAGVISLPLQLIGFNLISTYNIILLMTFVLAGWGAFLLCRYLTGNTGAAFVGGIVYAFAPYHAAHLFGHMNLASLQWIPFYVLFLLKAIDDVRKPGEQGKVSPFRIPASAFVAGAFLALNAYTEWTYAIFLVLLTGLIFLWKIVLPSERRESAEKGMSVPGMVLRFAVVGVVFLILSAPIFFPTLEEARKGYAQQPPEETLFYSADLINAFLPSEMHPIWGKEIAAKVQSIPPYLPLKNTSERVLFVGYSVLLFALWAVWRLRRDRRVVFWSLIAVLMWLLSLGPVLQVLGKRTFTAFGVEVPLPYLILYKLPLFSIMRTPARLTVMVMLALAIIVAFGVAALLQSQAKKAASTNPQSAIRNPKYALAVLLPLLILFEFVPVYPMVPPGWNVPIYQKIAAEPGNFALLEIPIRPMGDYMAYQTIHGKPIIGGYLSRQPPYPLLDENAAVHYVLDATPVDDPVAAQIGGGKGVQMLRDLGVKYVIIRWWTFTPEQKTVMEAKLANLLARPADLSYPADQVDVWQLSP